MDGTILYPSVDSSRASCNKYTSTKYVIVSSTVVLGVLRSGMKPFTPISRRACETFEKLTDRSGSRPLDQRVFRLGIYIVAGYTFRDRDPTAHKCNSTYQDYSRLYETTCSRGNPIRLTYPKTGGCVFFGCCQHPKRAKVSRDHLALTLRQEAAADRDSSTAHIDEGRGKE